jgi:hypothetical protein
MHVECEDYLAMQYRRVGLFGAHELQYLASLRVATPKM